MQPGRMAVVATIGASLASAAVWVSQSTTPAAPAPTLRSHLGTERFQVVTSIRGLPLGVRERMQEMFGSSTLDIAEPGADFQKDDRSAVATLPLRRLIAVGCANDGHCLVYYERGGATLTRRVMLFHWTPAETRFEWGGTALGGFAAVEDVRRAIVSGAIKSSQTDLW